MSTKSLTFLRTSRPIPGTALQVYSATSINSNNNKSNPAGLLENISAQNRCHNQVNKLSHRLFSSQAGTSACLGSASAQHSVPLTSERYPQFKRNISFKTIDENDIAAFKKILDAENNPINKMCVLTSEGDIAMYCADWLRKYRGSGSVVLRPRTAEQVSAILKHCNDNNIAVVPQGGNTGLVGGSVPVFDEVIVNLGLMNKVISFDDISGILECEAGCILESLDEYLSKRGYIMPLDLGAKGSCQIGGNVSTNAGGIRFLRYGSLHGSVLGVEAVLADGRIIDTLSPNRKDNTGYDLKQMFIGSEGTLGIVTKVSILAPQRSNAVNVAFLGCDSFQNVLKILKDSKKHLGEILSAFEFLDEGSMGATLNVPGNKNPLDKRYPFYVLIETSGSDQNHDIEKLERFLEHTMEAELCKDGVLSQDITQIHSFWKVRECISEGLLHDGSVLKYDISLPIQKYYDIVEDFKARLDGLAFRVCGYGHVGDGNLHLNITSKEYNPELTKKIEPYVYEYTQKNRGSISAEHGLGLMKANCIHYSKNDVTVGLMQQTKKMFDPKGILNPYKTVLI